MQHFILEGQEDGRLDTHTHNTTTFTAHTVSEDGREAQLLQWSSLTAAAWHKSWAVSSHQMSTYKNVPSFLFLVKPEPEPDFPFSLPHSPEGERERKCVLYNEKRRVRRTKRTEATRKRERERSNASCGGKNLLPFFSVSPRSGNSLINGLRRTKNSFLASRERWESGKKAKPWLRRTRTLYSSTGEEGNQSRRDGKIAGIRNSDSTLMQTHILNLHRMTFKKETHTRIPSQLNLILHLIQNWFPLERKGKYIRTHYS